MGVARPFCVSSSPAGACLGVCRNVVVNSALTRVQHPCAQRVAHHGRIRCFRRNRELRGLRTALVGIQRVRKWRQDGGVRGVATVRALEGGSDDDTKGSGLNGDFESEEKAEEAEEEEKGASRENVSNSASKFKQSFIRGTSRYYRELLNVTKEAGVDVEELAGRATTRFQALKEKTEEKTAEVIREIQGRLNAGKEQGSKAIETVRYVYWPQFVAWNRWELWKDIKLWDAQRAGAMVLYALLLGASVRGGYNLVTTPHVSKATARKLAEDYMESIIPESTEQNLRKLKKGLWREQMPEGFRAQKFVKGPDGVYKRDPSYVGENAWADDEDDDDETLEQIIESGGLTEEEKAELQELIEENNRARGLTEARVGTSDVADGVETNARVRGTDKLDGDVATPTSSDIPKEGSESPNNAPKQNWQERLMEWEKLIQREKIQDIKDDQTSKYKALLNHREIEANFTEEQAQKELQSYKQPAFWVARRWWKYRPKLPYLYFLAKVENLEVETAVYSTDTRKLYVTMKDGFPSEFVVDIPVDPYLYEALTSCGVETAVLPRSNFSFYGRAFLALIPSMLIILCIRALQYRTKEIFSEKIYDLLKMNPHHLILPEEAADKARSEYKDVVVGGDVWMVLEEIMMYMRNPMKYHNKRVKLPRGILISGPPGTGKTLLARAIARESGLPFVFASGAEFVESSTGNGSDKVFDIFFTARANAPSFVFIDEIDALAGKNVNDDAERRATFQQLLSELDGEPEDTDVDRFSLRQSVILICATNRPDELDESFVRPGRIDREIHIGLPGEKERIAIFGVHSAGKRLAKDVDFRKLVFRTIGYSGADIRNIINEAGIMAVRNKHEEITQQDFIAVLDKQLFEGMGMSLTDDEQLRSQAMIPEENKRLLAAHEAGHILLAHLYPRFDWHAFSHLLPGGSEHALTVFYPRQEMLQQGYTTVGYLRMQMVVAHGGRCAERVLFGEDISDGGQDDLAKITQIARELTISVSNRRLGLFPTRWQETLEAQKRPDEVDLIPNYWDKPGTVIAQMTTELSELFTREVTRYIDETEDQAMEALRSNEHILRRLTDELLARIKISGFEAEDIIRSMNPIMLPDPLAVPEVGLGEDMERKMAPNAPGLYQEMVIYPAPLHRC